VLPSLSMNGLIRGFSPGLRGLLAALAVSGAACNRDASSGHSEGAVTAPQGADCGHTSCGSNFFVDVVSPADCAAGANCAMTLNLVATGEYHINDDYPYKFRADDAPHVAFQGTDPAGANVFSKGASNWQKTGPQNGALSVVFQAADKGAKKISGVFKLSVCSVHNCQLEQTAINTTVSVH
jgi:hypothetical protein